MVKQVPVVIHRAIFGTFDRFTAFLIEETKGAMPLWLAPKQIEIIPVNSEIHADYAYKVKEQFASNGFRVEVDDRNEKLGYRIREAQLKKIPVEIVVGDNEKDNKTVNIRRYGKEGNTTLTIEEAIKEFKKEINK